MTRRHRGFRSYWSSPGAPMSLGCLGCPDLAKCGGQTIEGQGFNCLDHCCNQPADCSIVCPMNLLFVDRVREVAGLDLLVPAAHALPSLSLPGYVPLVFHGSSRSEELAVPAVAMPLYRFFDRSAACRFGCREDVCARFGLDPAADLLLSGVARDVEVERWWRLELKGRLKVISNLRRLGIAMVTTPNFSVVVNRPRWDDLHSMKRIADVHHEFVCEGLSAALHVNGRAQRDFERWAEFIVRHPEVTHLAFEFTTGTSNLLRMRQHAEWLAWLAQMAGRRLGLVLRGGVQVIGDLSAYFDVTFLDSSPFEKAHHRFVAVVGDDGMRRWISRHTPKGETVDALLAENVCASELWFRGLLPKLPLAA